MDLYGTEYESWKKVLLKRPRPINKKGYYGISTDDYNNQIWNLKRLYLNEHLIQSQSYLRELSGS